MQRIEVIGLDGDDTLWHNERSFRAGRDRFRRVLAATGVALTDEEIELHVTRTEVGNIDYFGYGVSSFVLSLIETAIGLSEGRVTGADLKDLIELAKHMLTEEIEVFPGAREAVTSLSASYPLMLVTKGDLLHQTSKLERSGLGDCFRFVEVVSHKTPATYKAILDRHGVDPRRFVMIGNSLRSDVLPVVEVGAWAVHVPSELSWSHEHADVPPETKARYFELSALDRIAEVIDAIERAQRGGVRARRSPLRRSGPAAGHRRPAGGNRRS